MWRYVRFLQIFAALFSRRVTASHAISAALKTVAAFATARETTAEASHATPDDGEDNEPSQDNNTNHRPLAEVRGHTIIPAANGGLEIRNAALDV